MSQQHDSRAIAWRDWGAEAFKAARVADKPVLLTLGATWCHWCHVMDETSYSDARVIELVTSRFIPVRVDVDQRPDIALRYNQGGFPSVAFLSTNGEFLAGRPYTPPDEMVKLLLRVSSGDFIADDGRRPHPGASPPGPAGGSADRVLNRLTELYDEDFGGFGIEPKQPPWEALHFLTTRYGMTGDRTVLRMVEHSLTGMWRGIYDNKDHGFFRYSVSRDWKVPHYEKMLVSNASLAMAYLEAYQITRRTAYKSAVEGIFRYLFATLFSPDEKLFYASQDADEPYYRTSWRDRDASEPPPVDRAFYAGWNALAADALIRAGSVLGNAGWRRIGADILEGLWQRSWTATGGLRRRLGEFDDDTPFLIDQAHFLRAWLTLYQRSGLRSCLERAVAVAGEVVKLFGAPDGGCYDAGRPRSFEAPFLPRERAALDNSCWAEALLILGQLTGEDTYPDLAAAALNIFQDVVPGKTYLGAHSSRRMEEDEEALFLPAGSAWGRAHDLLTQGPVSLVLVGDASRPEYRRLHQAALRVYAPHRVVRPLDSQENAPEISGLGFPLRDGAELYACMGDRCLAPVTTPAQVRELARSRPWTSG